MSKSKKKITTFSILMNALENSEIKDIRTIQKPKHLHIFVSSRDIIYDIYVYNKESSLLDTFYVKTNKTNDVLFLQKMEELCGNCEIFELMLKKMKPESKLFIYSTHYLIKELNTTLSVSPLRSKSISPTPTPSCFGCWFSTKSSSKTKSRGGKRKNATKTKKIYT